MLVAHKRQVSELVEGAAVRDAIIKACHIRLRPILMTSLAFIMGVVPLVISTGAGAEMRHAMGVTVFSGMIGVTVFGLLLTPLFYVVARKFTRRRLAPIESGTPSLLHHAASSDGVA